MIKRRCKENYYLDIAESVLIRGTCLRRNFGAIIVNSDQIVSSGYTGAPRNRKNCIECKNCFREKFNIPRGERYELCRSVHAEVNAIIFASRNEMFGGILFLVGKEMKTLEYIKNTIPCGMCKKIIINAGLQFVVIRENRDNFKKIDVDEWVKNDDTLNFVLGY